MKNILFLTGPHAVGKTYASKEVCNSYENIDMIDTGPIMRQLYKESGFGSSIGVFGSTGLLQEERMNVDERRAIKRNLFFIIKQ